MHNRYHLFPRLLLVAALVLIAPPGSADEPATGTAESPEAPTSQERSTVSESTDGTTAAPEGEAGLRAVIDPETGEFIVPPPAMQEELRHAFEALQVRGLDIGDMEQRVRPDGTVMAPLGTRFITPLMVTVDHDGNLHYSHGPQLGTAPETDTEEESTAGGEQ